ncbi:SGNH/GDSL hydrolase family protein [Anatilimnocola floriformis]|uniref:SGNH/GDSL hydrolase family protein n=1 Tax=Anatilimnocola floriformis TaxID=2948575 RepID=UPI0020C36425|nr:GDSL-type esterase/lipase family protein [Anatilimnocola floriformis]
MEEVVASPQKPAARKRRWLRAILLLGGALILLAAGYVHYWLYLPIGTGPAGRAVPLEPFQSPWTDRKVLLVGVGDSVTAGLGSTPGRSYFQRLHDPRPDDFADVKGRTLKAVLPNLTTLNIAQSGSNSLQHVEQVEKKLPLQPADVFGLVVMTSGGNDLIHWYGRTPPKEAAMYGATLAQAEPWIANYGQRMNELFTRIDEKFPGGCLIFVCDIYDPSDGYGNPESAYLPPWPDCVPIHTRYNEALRASAAKHAAVCLVPMHAEFLGHGIHCRKFWSKHYRSADPHYWYFENLEDPNDRGYDAVRRLMLLRMVEERETIAAKQGN